MPRSIITDEEILNAMDKTPMLSGVPINERKQWLQGFVDKDNGKRSGSFVHLLAYEHDETVLLEDEWGGNDFLILVEGALDVFMRDPLTDAENKVNRILPGESFGEMSLFAGVPRIASVVSIATESVVLKIARQAFRGLEKKAPEFIERLSDIYSMRALDTAIERLRQITADGLDRAQLDLLRGISGFKVFGRSHVLSEKGQAIDRVFLIHNGWVRRSNDLDDLNVEAGWARIAGEGFDLDFLGAGNFLGFEALTARTPAAWKYSATVMLRTEVIEIDLASLRANPALCAAISKALAPFAVRDTTSEEIAAVENLALASVEEVVTTGIVETENLLVMDMDLCIRCGNCSLACEKVHGHSRLVRRGIHIERATPTRPKDTQHLLVPEVCIHCQDPECLTGCPTGAIARLAHGQIDIEAATCTGCTACARLCPYNAISMIQEIPPPQVHDGFPGRMRSWLGLKPPILPASVTGTKKEVNLIAAKCNLCEDTPLNPVGVRVPAYSCEENCPTGALVRVNPRDYFGEVQQRLHPVFQTPKMTVGRNIHRSDPLWWGCHVIGGLITFLILGGEFWAWLRHGLDQRLAMLPFTLRWLTGTVGAVTIFGAMLYSRRRRIYRRRAGPLRYWMLAHIYLGAMAAVAILLHGGKHGGGLLTTILMLSFDLLIVTGSFGIIAYYVAPRLLTSIEGDPNLLEDLQGRREELRAELHALQHNESALLILGQGTKHFTSVRYLLRQVWRREELSALLAAARAAYRPRLGSLAESDQEALLEHFEKLATLRRLDALIYLHRVMKIWLPPHIVAGSVMLALLVIHILQVLVFAAR